MSRLLIALIVSLSAVFMSQTPVFTRLELILFDLRARVFSGSLLPPEEIVVVLIDEQSLREVYKATGISWPWSWELYALITDFFTISNVKALVYDIHFSETKEQSPSLPDSIRRNSRVIFPVQFFPSGGLGLRPLPEGLASLHAIKSIEVSGNSFLRKNNDYIIPLKPVYENAWALGSVSFTRDPDGVYRRNYLIWTYDKYYFPGLALSAYLKTSDVSHIKLSKDQLLVYKASARVEVPLENGRYLIKPYPKFNSVSMSAILSTIHGLQQGDLEKILVDPKEFNNKIVFVGASASGLGDLKISPLSNSLPGVFLHANILANLIKEDFLKLVPILWVDAFLFSLICLIISRFSLFYSLFFVLFTLSFLFAFYYFNVVFNITYFAISGFGTFLTALWISITQKEREKTQLKKSFERYVSKATLSQILENPDKLVGIKTQRVELTLLMSDIMNFTTIMEDIEPEKAVEMLNIYFDKMVDVLFKNGATIDKFIGDGIFAFFGAPIELKDHPERAVRAALEMKKALSLVNETLKGLNLPQLSNGIGIHTDRVILGNIGSKTRLDYTAIGDGVNLTARLESVTRFYGVGIAISESTFQRLNNSFLVRPIDLIRVKGRQKPVMIYEPLDDQYINLAELTHKAFKEYLSANFLKALELYSKALEIYPNDKLSRIFQDRCKKLIEYPPANWEGIFTLEHK
ncbi:MAG: adenylate/guanylate cyclase domain-containing protein [Aquificaceae bacterium]